MATPSPAWPSSDDSSSSAKMNLHDVEQTWQVLVGDLKSGEIVELRQLPGAANPTIVPRVAYARSHDEYFRLIKEAAVTPASIYAGINPRDASRYELAPGSWKSAANATSNASHVTRRKWLSFDCDPVCAIGFTKFNATEAERELFRRELNLIVTSAGLGVVLQADSGNGAHLIARVDLKNDPATAEAVDKWFKSFRRKYSGEHLRIDSTFDAARIVKVVGTFAHGKLETANRPARMTKWLGFTPPTLPPNATLLEQIFGNGRKYKKNDGASGELGLESDEEVGSFDRIFAREFKTVDISEKLAEALRLDPALAALWEGNFADLEDSSKTALEVLVATILAKRVFDENEIFSALQLFPYGWRLEISNWYRTMTILQAFETANTVALEHFSNFAVLGVSPNGRAVIFVKDKRAVHEIDLARIKEVQMQLLIGNEFNRLVNIGTVEIAGRILTKIRFRDLLTAIAAEARKTEFRKLRTIGNGIWNLKDGIVLVGEQSLLLRSGHPVEEVINPVQAGNYLCPNLNTYVLPAGRIKQQLNVWNQRCARKTLLEVNRRVAQWKFKRRGTSLLLTALLAATWLESIWQWRPMVWLTAESGAGKSLFVRFLEQILGPSTVLLEGTPTEAVLREKLKFGAVPLLLDEFEGSRHRDKILEMLRCAGRGGVFSIGGKVGGRDIEIRHLAWVSSVDVSLPRAADRSRWIVIEMEKLVRTITAPNDPANEKLGLDFFVSTVWAALRARELEAILRHVQIPNVDPRIRDNFIVPAAALGAILGLSEKRTELILKLWVRRFSEEDLETDQQKSLREILSARIRFQDTQTSDGHSKRETSVAQALSHSEAAAELNVNGIRVLKESVFFAGKVISNMLLGRKSEECDLNRTLARLPGARPDKQRIAGIPTNGVTVPLAYIHQFLEVPDPPSTNSQDESEKREAHGHWNTGTDGTQERQNEI
jgi:hypothetical protein